MAGSQGINTCKGVKGTGLREETLGCDKAVAEASADAHGGLWSSDGLSEMSAIWGPACGLPLQEGNNLGWNRFLWPEEIPGEGINFNRQQPTHLE